LNDLAASTFQFDWEESRGLDLHLVEWQGRVTGGHWAPQVFELSQALYSAFAELRKIRRIMTEAKPGIVHSYYQFGFELFAHNHFISIAATRVLKIVELAYPDAYQRVVAEHEAVKDQVVRYRNALEHQTEIGRGKGAPAFFNNLSDKGYESARNSLPYADIEHLLNRVMELLEQSLPDTESAGKA
jgi:hypothetical protein